MFQVKRNSREFNDIREAFAEFASSPGRTRLILLYALRPSETLEKRVLLNNLKPNGKLLYDMHYDTIIEYFRDKDEKLYREDAKPLYYFKTSPDSDWLELPFELAGKLRTKIFPLRKIK